MRSAADPCPLMLRSDLSCHIAPVMPDSTRP